MEVQTELISEGVLAPRMLDSSSWDLETESKV